MFTLGVIALAVLVDIPDDPGKEIEKIEDKMTALETKMRSEDTAMRVKFQIPEKTPDPMDQLDREMKKPSSFADTADEPDEVMPDGDATDPPLRDVPGPDSPDAQAPPNSPPGAAPAAESADEDPAADEGEGAYRNADRAAALAAAKDGADEADATDPRSSFERKHEARISKEDREDDAKMDAADRSLQELGTEMDTQAQDAMRDAHKDEEEDAEAKKEVEVEEGKLRDLHEREKDREVFDLETGKEAAKDAKEMEEDQAFEGSDDDDNNVQETRARGPCDGDTGTGIDPPPDCSDEEADGDGLDDDSPPPEEALEGKPPLPPPAPPVTLLQNSFLESDEEAPFSAVHDEDPKIKALKEQMRKDEVFVDEGVDAMRRKVGHYMDGFDPMASSLVQAGESDRNSPVLTLPEMPEGGWPEAKTPWGEKLRQKLQQEDKKEDDAMEKRTKDFLSKFEHGLDEDRKKYPQMYSERQDAATRPGHTWHSPPKEHARHHMPHMEGVDGGGKNRHRYHPQGAVPSGEGAGGHHRTHMHVKHSPHLHHRGYSFVEETPAQQDPLANDPTVAKMEQIKANMDAQTRKFEQEAQEDALMEEQMNAQTAPAKASSLLQTSDDQPGQIEANMRLEQLKKDLEVARDHDLKLAAQEKRKGERLAQAAKGDLAPSDVTDADVEDARLAALSPTSFLQESDEEQVSDLKRQIESSFGALKEKMDSQTKEFLAHMKDEGKPERWSSLLQVRAKAGEPFERFPELSFGHMRAKMQKLEAELATDNERERKAFDPTSLAQTAPGRSEKESQAEKETKAKLVAIKQKLLADEAALARDARPPAVPIPASFLETDAEPSPFDAVEAKIRELEKEVQAEPEVPSSLLQTQALQEERPAADGAHLLSAEDEKKRNAKIKKEVQEMLAKVKPVQTEKLHKMLDSLKKVRLGIEAERAKFESTDEFKQLKSGVASSLLQTLETVREKVRVHSKAKDFEFVKPKGELSDVNLNRALDQFQAIAASINRDAQRYAPQDAVPTSLLQDRATHRSPDTDAKSRKAHAAEQAAESGYDSAMDAFGKDTSNLQALNDDINAHEDDEDREDEITDDALKRHQLEAEWARDPDAHADGSLLQTEDDAHATDDALAKAGKQDADLWKSVDSRLSKIEASIKSSKDTSRLDAARAKADTAQAEYARTRRRFEEQSKAEAAAQLRASLLQERQEHRESADDKRADAKAQHDLEAFRAEMHKEYADMVREKQLRKD